MGEWWVSSDVTQWPLYVETLIWITLTCVDVENTIFWILVEVVRDTKIFASSALGEVWKRWLLVAQQLMRHWDRKIELRQTDKFPHNIRCQYYCHTGGGWSELYGKGYIRNQFPGKCQRRQRKQLKAAQSSQPDWNTRLMTRSAYVHYYWHFEYVPFESFMLSTIAFQASTFRDACIETQEG